jgi:hypothetical protein
MHWRFSPGLSPSKIEDRFEEAALTLRRLSDDKPQGYFNIWPPIVRTTCEIIAKERQPMKVLATPQTIDRMDECFAWLFWLKPDEARVVWMRAEGMRWKPICRKLGVSRVSAWRWWAAALIKISHRLAAEEKARTPKPRKQAS